MSSAQHGEYKAHSKSAHLQKGEKQRENKPGKSSQLSLTHFITFKQPTHSPFQTTRAVTLAAHSAALGTRCATVIVPRRRAQHSTLGFDGQSARKKSLFFIPLSFHSHISFQITHPTAPFIQHTQQHLLQAVQHLAHPVHSQSAAPTHSSTRLSLTRAASVKKTHFFHL